MFYEFLLVTLLFYILHTHITAINVDPRQKNRHQRNVGRRIEETLRLEPSYSLVTGTGAPPPPAALSSSSFATDDTNSTVRSTTPAFFSMAQQPVISAKQREENERLRPLAFVVISLGITSTFVMFIYICKESIPNNANSVATFGLSRLVLFTEPFAANKPCRLSFDANGLCHASPLPATENPPPLPTYMEAIQMPQNPFLMKGQSCSITTPAVEDTALSSPPMYTKYCSTGITIV